MEKVVQEIFFSIFYTCSVFINAKSLLASAISALAFPLALLHYKDLRPR